MKRAIDVNRRYLFRHKVRPDPPSPGFGVAGRAGTATADQKFTTDGTARTKKSRFFFRCAVLNCEVR